LRCEYGCRSEALIDIASVSMFLNFDFCQSKQKSLSTGTAEQGRARFLKGDALFFLCPKDGLTFKAVEAFLRNVSQKWLKGLWSPNLKV